MTCLYIIKANFMFTLNLVCFFHHSRDLKELLRVDLFAQTSFSYIQAFFFFKFLVHIEHVLLGGKHFVKVILVFSLSSTNS